MNLPPLQYHAIQSQLYHEQRRFKVAPAGRRSGKTELSKRKVIDRATDGTRFSSARFFCGAPTRDQAKRIFWTDLKKYTPKFLIKDISESALVISLINDSEIHVLGFDKPERVEGTPWDGGVLDEYGNMKPEVWPEHVRPALSDRLGWCWMIGVPEGRNHYYDLFSDALKPETLDWGGYTWFSEDILPPEEIAAAKRDLDLLTYEQEYEASFVTFEGRAYYSFSDRNKRKTDYDPEADLILCLDFNVSPGVAAIIQEEVILTPDGVIVKGQSRTLVIDEVYIRRGSNTLKVCEAFIKRYSGHEGDVYVYGDATGGAAGTGKVLGSDWELVEQALRPVFGDRLFFMVPKANPREKLRINAVNSRIKSVSGLRRLFVDPNGAPMVVKDFEGVRFAKDGTGEIDKKKDRMLTHLTDAIGYYIVKEFPIVSVQEGMVALEGF